MQTHLLPHGTDLTEPHIPILASTHIAAAARTVLLLGDSIQDLGVFALRIIGGHGGINAGSAVDFVKYVHSQVGQAFPESGEEGRPAVLLANCGQLHWNRRHGRAMTRVSWDSQTRESAVHDASVYEPAVNTVEGMRDQKAHIEYILSTVVPALCKEGGNLDVIAIADSARYVCGVLDENWDGLKGRMQSLACVFPFHDRKMYQNEGFRQWLVERGRGYIMAESPAGMGLFGPDGGREAWQWGYGMNVYGLPVEVAEESVFPRHFRGLVDWMGEVAGVEGYVNEEVVVVDVESAEEVVEKGEEWGEELVGAEIWGTEAGMRQLRGEVATEWKAEEKGDVDGGNETIERVKEGEVNAQQVKEEAEKDAAQPENETTHEAIAHTYGNVKAQLQKEQPENDTAQTNGAAQAQLQKQETEKDTAQLQKQTTKELPIRSANNSTSKTLNEVSAKLARLGYDGAEDEPSSSTSTSTSTPRSTSATSSGTTSTSSSTSISASNTIPPERMERLPSYVETDEGEPLVELSKEEKAAILQITVLSSPVKGGKGKEGEEKGGEGKGGKE